MNHQSQQTTNETTTVLSEKVLEVSPGGGETEPCLVRTNKTESIRIVNLVEPNDDERATHSVDEYMPKMTCLEKVYLSYIYSKPI